MRLGGAREQQDAALIWLKVDPHYDTMRADPHFEEFLKSISGIP